MFPYSSWCLLQDEYDEVLAQYMIERAQLSDLEKRFAPLNMEFQTIMTEREALYAARKTAEREEERRVASALIIQAWWRSYRVRKALAAKAKKLAKNAKKKGAPKNRKVKK
jgi:aminoglycoside N3'-acetyltransferase